jgi:hypothetical protein
METIFVKFPALDDSEVFATIEDAFKKAKYPDRIFVGVALLYSTRRYKRDFKKFIKPYKEKVKYSGVKVTARNVFETLGVGKGRVLADSLYKNEDYVLQVDSHTWFCQDWDEKLIALHKKASKTLSLNKVILTGYSGHYNYTGPDTRNPTTNEGMLRYPFLHKEQRFSDVIPNWFDVPLPKDYPKEFVPCIKFNANFAFGDKEFGKYSGVLEDAVFFEEELTQTISLVKNGFNLVFPNIRFPLICHLYSEHANEYGGHRTGIPDYMSGMVSDIFTKNVDLNFTNFVNDPKNKDAIEKWEKYSKCSLTFGPLREHHIPDYYINQPDSDLKL